MRRRQAGGDICAGAETRIEQTHVAQPVERLLIAVQPLRLEGDFAVPADPQPFEIAEDCVDMLGAAAGAVDILDAQAEASAGGAREIM
jgi:hypothetical protein